MLKEWREQIDHNKIVGTVLLDLSKAFDCIPHDLFIAKLNAYGFDKNTLTLLFSYLKNRKQSARIKTSYRSFLELLSGVPQGSILGTLLFDIFLNDLFLYIKKASLHNYADDNTLSAFATDIDDLIQILTDESQKTIDWLKLNQMIVNPKKFQAMFISKKIFLKCLTKELNASNK